MNVYRRIPSDPADWFSAEEVAKAKEYQRPLSRVRMVRSGVNVVALLAVIWTQAAPWLADAVGAEAWWARLLVVLGGLIGLFAVLDLPFAIWQTFGHDRRWGFSTETPRTFVMDAVKGLLVSFVLLSVLLLPVWAIIRATDLWWVYGWAAFFVFSIGLALLYPVVIMPIFNKFEPLEDEELAEQLREMGRNVGVRISDVLVMDASKRTRKDNAMMTGLGKTRRVVIFDNMLEYPSKMIGIVVAHELSHWRRRHIPKSAVIGAVVTFLLFVAIRVATAWEPALEWAGVASVQDPAIIPLVALVFSAGTSLVGIVRNWLARAWEREADLDALETTRDPESFKEMMRRMATKNLADLAPSSWEYLTKYSHPPIPERLAMGALWQESGRAAEREA